MKKNTLIHKTPNVNSLSYMGSLKFSRNKIEDFTFILGDRSKYMGEMMRMYFLQRVKALSQPESSYLKLCSENFGLHVYHNH